MNWYLGGMLISVTLASCSQILLKKSAMMTYANPIREYCNMWVISGYGLLFCSMLITIWAYSGMEYKNGPVIEALGNVLVPLLSFWIFHEKMTRRRLIGIGCIVLGIVVFYS